MLEQHLSIFSIFHLFHIEISMEVFNSIDQIFYDLSIVFFYRLSRYFQSIQPVGIISGMGKAP